MVSRTHWAPMILVCSCSLFGDYKTQRGSGGAGATGAGASGAGASGAGASGAGGGGGATGGSGGSEQIGCPTPPVACVPESEPECQGGAGGAGGAPPGCCLSIEDCFTLDSETPAGNQACGEVAQGHSFVVVPDTTTSQRFNATGTVPGRLLTWGNVFGPKGEVGAQLQRLNLNGPLQYDFSAQWPNMDSGRTTGDVLVLPPPGSRATVGFLLGTCSGQTKGLACPGEMAVA